MTSADESKTPEVEGPKTPVERLMRLTIHPAELDRSGTGRMQALLGSDNLIAQKHFLRFRCGGPGL